MEKLENWLVSLALEGDEVVDIEEVLQKIAQIKRKTKGLNQ